MAGNDDDAYYNGDYYQYSNYDYSHYYDIVEFNVTSIQPSTSLLAHTTGFTVISVFIGFIFKCRKKKWRKKKGEPTVKSIDQEEAVQTSLACGDPSIYMCAIDEVIDNAFFDHDHENNSDAGSVDSDNSSKAYEDLFGPDQNQDRYTAAPEVKTSLDTGVDTSNGTNNSYELFYEDERNKLAKKGNHVKLFESSPQPPFEIGATGSESERESPYRAMVNSETSHDEPRKTNENTKIEPYTKSKALITSSHRSPTSDKKKIGFRRFQFSRKKSITSDNDNDRYRVETATRHLTLCRVLHSPNNCEIELKEGKFPVGVDVGVGGHDESYEKFNDREDPNEVDKFTDPNLNCSADESNISKNEVIDRSGEGDDTYENEMREINKLVCAWTVSSFISDFASIISIALIASYMSIAEMICYSYVWFIIDAAFLFSTALYNSMYKHVSNAIAPDTDEGYFKAGKYIRISIIINLILSIPISVAVIFGMGSIFRMYGFEEQMVQLCSSYTIIAIIHHLTTSISDYIASIIEIEGHADFNAKYSFFDSLVEIALSFFVIPVLKPSLIQLGIVHYTHAVLSSAFYYYLTWYKYGIYDPYVEGLTSPLTFDRKDKKAFATLIKKAIPMAVDELNEQLEWLVSAYLASFLGNAESTSWILLSYVWSLVGKSSQHKLSYTIFIILISKLHVFCRIFKSRYCSIQHW